MQIGSALLTSSTCPRSRERNPIKLVFAVRDVEKERTKLEALGVMVLVRSRGGCEVVDPEGNIFGLTQSSP
jgi:predicted enzyme related to lactoylglutathione lyase